MDHHTRDHAVVIGASMGGLLAARVLSDHFRQVTIIERDELPSHWANRRGVPQGRHAHGLLPRGRQVIEQFFPGISDHMKSGGALELDDLTSMYFRVGPHLLSRQPRPVESFLQQSRPYLEGEIRARVRALPNVQVREQTSVIGPTATSDRSRVTGVEVSAAGGGPAEVLPADLVVDCSGRGGRTPAWLEQLGYERPAEDELHVRLCYVSQLLRLDPGAGTPPFVLEGCVPGRPTGYALFEYENDTWLLTVAGMAGIEPSTDLDARVAMLAEFAEPVAVAAIAGATPLSEPVTFRYPTARRRRYEKLRRFPEGLLVLGDAICSFDPIYGQGMTVASLEALALDDALRSGDRGLARRYFRAAARPVGVAWDLATGADLTLPEIEGPRPFKVRAINAWVDRVLQAAADDPEITDRFLKVMAFLRPPTDLFAPTVVRAALRGGRSSRSTRRTATTVPA